MPRVDDKSHLGINPVEQAARDISNLGRFFRENAVGNRLPPQYLRQANYLFRPLQQLIQSNPMAGSRPAEIATIAANYQVEDNLCTLARIGVQHPYNFNALPINTLHLRLCVVELIAVVAGSPDYPFLPTNQSKNRVIDACLEGVNQRSGGPNLHDLMDVALTSALALYINSSTHYLDAARDYQLRCLIHAPSNTDPAGTIGSLLVPMVKFSPLERIITDQSVSNTHHLN